MSGGKPTRPNFLIFCTDQMQSACLGIHGHPDVRTPNLDRLAAEGTTFRRAYCTNPICTPSRASLITGLMPRQHGALTNGTPLPENVPTVVGVLAAAGYRTHAVGKLHLQPWMGYGPHRADPHLPFSWEDQVRWDNGEIDRLPSPFYGFQSVDYVGGHVEYVHGEYVNWLKRQDPAAQKLYIPDRGDRPRPERGDTWRLAIPEELHYNNWIADRTIDFLSAASPGSGGLDSGNFLLWCSFPDPHFPFAAPRPYSEMFDPASVTLPETWNAEADPTGLLAERRRSYAGATFDEADLREIIAQTCGMIAHVDAQIGRVLRRLEQTGLAENTVVGFTADHGEYLGAHHLLYKSVWPYEELYRVPMILRLPRKARVPANPRLPTGAVGQVVDTPVSGLDLVPTIAELAGAPLSAFDMRGYGRANRPTLPGVSLAGVAGGEPAPDRPVLIEMDEDGLPGTMTRMRTIVRGRHKLTVFGGTGEGLLTDLSDDPRETISRWSDPAWRDVRCDLLAALADELARTDRLDVRRISGA